jgi:hypothetical protein
VTDPNVAAIQRDLAKLTVRAAEVRAAMEVVRLKRASIDWEALAAVDALNESALELERAMEPARQVVEGMTNAAGALRALTDGLRQIADATATLRHMGVQPALPADLVAAARALSDTAVPDIPLPPEAASLPISKLAMQVIQPDEVVSAPALRRRMASIGVDASTSAITMALTRAEKKGELERVEPGLYRRPSTTASADSARCA